MQEHVMWTAGIDVGWAPHERVKLDVGYMHESYYGKMEEDEHDVQNTGRSP